jgi:hypothetical protein
VGHTTILPGKGGLVSEGHRHGCCWSHLALEDIKRADRSTSHLRLTDRALGRCTAGCRGHGATGRRRRTGQWQSHLLPVAGCGRANGPSWRGCGPKAREKDKRIRELEMERDVCKRFVALRVK